MATSLAAADPTLRRWARRLVVVLVLGAQLAFVVRAYHAPHKELGFQMFPEASDWRADIVRVTTDGRRVPIDQPWPGGYRWSDLVDYGSLGAPEQRQHADDGLANTLAHLQAALDYVADHTPADRETVVLEADVTSWYDTGPPQQQVLRSHPRTP